MVHCCVLGCRNRSERRSKNITFHSFPKDLTNRSRWINFTGRKNWRPSKHGRLCSSHFEGSCFYKTKYKVYLQNFALPTLCKHDLSSDKARENLYKKSKVRATVLGNYGLLETSIRRVTKKKESQDGESEMEEITENDEQRIEEKKDVQVDMELKLDEMIMSATSALENNEDLENVPLVRMEDVQPDRSVEVVNLPPKCIEVIDGGCVINEDDNSNIGSMVSIQSEEVVYWQDDNSDSSEIIVPDVDPLQLQHLEKPKPKPRVSDSWPTLEILPGGVIKNANKYEYDLSSSYNNILENENKNDAGMYVCAKCSESFDSLILLVKHVRWHEVERKKEMEKNKLKLQSNKKFSSRSCKRKFIIDLKNKCKKPKKT
ncbi:THAP domain-containing protein 1-like [Battus philenor]|uniref:THAP domain-containing protein 1-like n=1 Tax=Battus philenor TaxID=42288 RepID=UPI0035D0BCFB